MSERPAAKRGQLSGGAISEEALSSSRSVLRRAHRGGRLGLQQYFSPPEAARLAREVFADAALPVLDPTAGAGDLLGAFEQRFGIEVDSDHVRAARYTAIQGDLQRVYPLLRLLGVSFPAVVLNPPFGLTWRDHAGAPVSSTLQSLRYALGLLADRGQGMMIAPRDRFWREVAPELTGLYCAIECDELFEGVALPVLIAFFVKGRGAEGQAPPLALEASRPELPALAARVRSERDARGYLPLRHGDADFLTDAFAHAAREHRRRIASERGKAPRYDLTCTSGRLACHPSAFAKVALAERGLDRVAEGVNGKALHYFVLAPRDWRALQAAGEEGALQIDPALPELVERALREAVRDATPLYPVRAQMRLGFLEDLETLRCTTADVERGFAAGERYPLHTRTRVLKEEGERVVQLRSGEQSVRRAVRERRLLEVSVGSESFDESKESIEYLLEHFEIPDPGDIASRFPSEYERAIAVVRAIESEHLSPRGYSYRRFQVEDLARLLVKGKGPLCWDTGLGKTLGQLTWALACERHWRCQDAALFVMPQDLLDQFADEVRRFFGREVELIQSQGKARAVDRHVRAGGRGWYATYYEALSLVGRREEALPVTPVRTDPARRLRSARPQERQGRAGADLDSSEFCPQCLASAAEEWNATVCRRCGYVHKSLKVPSIGSLLAGTFRRGVICVDELTEMQGDDSLRGKAVRGLRCAHPLGATATLISNHVDSAFHGLWWCCGNASTRFPYDLHGKSKFEGDFCVIEHVYGDAEKGEENVRKRRKILPEVTNLSVLWRLLCTNMVRKRKEDCGEEIVPRYFRPVKVPPGVAQLSHHEQVLKQFPRWFTETHPHSPLVAAGLVEQFAAGCGMLPKLDYAATMPEADPDHEWWGVPSSNWTPAALKVLELALSHTRAGEKVLIGSSLIETGPWLAARLSERGVRALHITEPRDGRAQTKSPRKRAAELKAFRAGDAQTLCVGVGAVKFGHNLPEVSAVILHGTPWTYLAVKQFVDRAWRLTSKAPVNVYVVYVPGMIGERKWELVKDKGEASDLALDGELISEPEPAIDWNAELRKMRAAGVTTSGEEVPEAEVKALWERAQGPFAPLAPPRSQKLPARRSGEEPAWETEVEVGEQTSLFAA